MIEARNIGKTFGGVPALTPISLSIGDNSTVVLCGPSGCGKTTFLRILAGLELPDSGEVLINGKTVSTPDGATEPHTRGIGVVFQRPALWPHMTVEQNIMFGITGVARQERRHRAAELISALGLDPLARRHPGRLSGGEARRVAIARALAPRPQHLLMDEPLTSLDPDTRDRALALILRHTRAHGQSVLWITHDATEASSVSQNIVKLAPPGNK